MADQESAGTLRKDSLSKDPEDDAQVYMRDLPPTLRKILDETPRKQWTRVKGILADSWETVELFTITLAVRHLLKVAPEKLLARIMDGEVEMKKFASSFRTIRERISHLREACQDVAELALIELRVWSDKPEGEGPAAGTDPAPRANPVPRGKAAS
jgi:hypothetical protein